MTKPSRPLRSSRPAPDVGDLQRTRFSQMDFREFVEAHRTRLEAIAWKFAPRDPSMRDEARQAGLLALWLIDPSRFTDDDETLLMLRVADSIRNMRKAERRAQCLGRTPLVSGVDLERVHAEAVGWRFTRRGEGDMASENGTDDRSDNGNDYEKEDRNHHGSGGGA